MQNPKWVIGLASAFVLMTVISGILEGVYGTGATRLQVLISPAFWPPSAAWEYVKNLWAILTFDYSFFYGSWTIFRYAIFLPITVGLIAALGIEVFLRIRIPFVYN
jgi:hypothetical protein